ncbi:MAG TPA: hypothetical protein VLW06_09815 [Terriglobales bacterium]|nr:hypothetical protein [Terriglobales bacterium]
MKPNGKHFAVRTVFLALSMVTLFSRIGSAEMMRGRFKVTAETHWGKLLLLPGEYEFTLNDDNPSGTLLTVRSEESEWSGMILAEAVSAAKLSDGTKLILARSESGLYVEALCLGNVGTTYIYATPKSGKFTRLTKVQPASATLASVSASQH